MTGQEIGMACHGLRGMSNLYPIVQNWMFLLANRIEQSVSRGLRIEANEISMAIEGLRSVTGRSILTLYFRYSEYIV